jgi:hypothetical protein
LPPGGNRLPSVDLREIDVSHARGEIPGKGGEEPTPPALWTPPNKLEGESIPPAANAAHSLLIGAAKNAAQIEERQMRKISNIIIATALFATSVGVAVAQEANDRLLIVNGNSGHVIYDDGRDDLYCVTRRRVVGYDDWGRPIHRRKMRCR